MTWCCERCQFAVYTHHNRDGSTTERMGDIRWCMVDGIRKRLCLGCVADLRMEGRQVTIR